MYTQESIKVLVVDNNPVIVKSQSAFLQKENCEVFTAENGLIALDILGKEKIDIVLTDLVMPFVEGDVLCKILRTREEFRHIFIVIFSAIANEARKSILEDVPYDLCFGKSHLVQMKRQVKEALEAFRLKQQPNTPSTTTASIVQEDAPSVITRELLKKANYLQSVLSHLGEGVIELSHKGQIVGINPAAETIFSKSQEQSIGLDLIEFTPWGEYEDNIQHWLNSSLMGDRLTSFTINEESPLYVGERVVTCDFTLIADASPKVGICIFHDITRQYHAEKHKKKVESALGDIRKMEAMRDMAGGFAHDFNNLLTAICGNLDIIMAVERNTLSAKTADLIKNTKKAASLATDLTKKISVFSDFGIVEREKTDISSFIRHSTKAYFSQNKHAYIEQVLDKDLWIDINRDEIRTALHNILDNALEAVQEKSDPIEVTLQKVSYEEPKLMGQQYLAKGNYIQITIADNGCGISEEDLPQVFDPYFSNKERSSTKGLGLGLAITYSTMSSHGGYVVIDSLENSGTKVHLFFPYVHVAENVGSKKCVILVEPDQQLLETTSVMLQYLGLTTYCFTTNDEAFSFYTENSELRSDPKSCALVIDINENIENKSNGVNQNWENLIPKELLIGTCSLPSDSLDKSIVKTSGVSFIINKPYSLKSLQESFQHIGFVPPL